MEIVVYQDLLCAWCYVAQARLDSLIGEWGPSVRWVWRPYALRVDESPLKHSELNDWLAQVEGAKREKEGERLSSGLWTEGEPPRSSVLPLVALEAARLQGEDAFFRFMSTARRAALEQAVNVARPDVLFEIAGALRLDMHRFAAAMRSRQLRELVLEEYRLAVGRGVTGAPTLVLGNRWMISGLREASEYRSLILECLGKDAARRRRPPDALLH